MASLPHQLEANYVSVVNWDVEIDAPESVLLSSIRSMMFTTIAIKRSAKTS